MGPDVIGQAWKDVLDVGIVGTFLVISMFVNFRLWKRIQTLQQDKLVLFERFMVSRETMIDKYHEFVRQSDKTMADLIQALRSLKG